MKTITSTENPLVRHIVRLAKDNLYRQQTQQAVIEGIHLVEGLSHSHSATLDTLIYSAEKGANQEIVDLVKANFSQAIEVPPGVFKKLSTLSSPDGLMAVINIHSYRPSYSSRGFCLMLDNIQDPGNVGTLLRSAAASGFNRILLSKGCAHVWSPKVLRAAMGAHFVLSIHEQVEVLESLTQTHQEVWLAALTDSSEDYKQVNLSQPFTLVIGNEGSGIDPQLLKHYSNHLHIPMINQVESLNAAVAGSIIMFESLRQQSPFTKP
ncbi:MAG: hypothetical protein B7Z60_01555 [Ferrovum sp. 37-45-19]|jgi:TrmH family RNA methyltransferase|uniref:TrmH family RNA methyltransferase n=1 Tax=Ferrovum sp. JA12 TaxID=1356299 RepID=UPI000702D5EB|nr:RNA methyltransferase [Ferrovum sp. JA12]OYV80696.1 MAG: hypothetical protein B7Z65_00440 [Ferrovum sp. 21-44-67]OYV95247.1 MAG: hypothetical protein B7Z60_01555 [Ferrovum sp. 37-45-19]OZB33731.1 MAG: hypothetical protein B7X47_03110 [Ferrovum sp. 34-44-207]HQT80753.1 RNA methyltransferase [Ferrovaceae bacterium]KRH79846.1 putative TrmH family tRNA/rRNA methyltransferase [Ferrovum sp. JA12]